MALTTNSVAGSTVILSIATNLTTPVYKAIVCSSGDLVLDSTAEGAQTTVTRCGTAKSAGTPSYSLKFEGLLNTTISSTTELSGNELFALNDSKATILWQLESPSGTNYFRSGSGIIGAFTETSPIGDFVKFSGTIEVSGAVDYTV